MIGIDVVECEHRGETMNVYRDKGPVTHVAREDEETRLFLIVDADNWLLRRCVSGED